MTNKDIKLNIKLDTPAISQDNSLLNKLFIALGLSLSTSLTDSLDFNSPIIIISLLIVMIVIAFITSKKK